MLNVLRERMSCSVHTARALRRVIAGLLVAGLGVLPAAVQAQPSPATLAEMKALYQRPKSVPSPANNVSTPAKVQLGYQLFFDARLSGHGNVSCATCHNPALAWGDGQSYGTGWAGNRLGRRTPTILNLAWAEMLFWDGRAESLEEQALGPIENPDEMAMPLPKLVTTLRDIPGYRSAFSKAFPGEAISTATIGKAIAAFERTVVSATAPFDRWIEGDENAIDPSAKRGFVVFNTKARCASCHSGWRFTDDSFHDIGLPDDDIGRAKVVSGVNFLRHAFKTPTLRNVVERAPYMHNGSKLTLFDVITHYNAGFDRRPSLSADIKKLNLNGKDFEDLTAFLQTLSSNDPMVTPPALTFEESRR